MAGACIDIRPMCLVSTSHNLLIARAFVDMTTDIGYWQARGYGTRIGFSYSISRNTGTRPATPILRTSRMARLLRPPASWPACLLRQAGHSADEVAARIRDRSFALFSVQLATTTLIQTHRCTLTMWQGGCLLSADTSVPNLTNFIVKN
jgi:hypothetical protein